MSLAEETYPLADGRAVNLPGQALVVLVDPRADEHGVNVPLRAEQLRCRRDEIAVVLHGMGAGHHAEHDSGGIDPEYATEPGLRLRVRLEEGRDRCRLG